MSDNRDYTGVLLEDMNSKMDAVVEAVGQINDQIKVLPAMQADLEEVKADVKTIKSVAGGHSGQLTDHEERLSVLEAA